MEKKRASLKTIAKELNISISTVSRALRNTGEINPETRKAVLELAERWDYTPDPLALGLLKSKTSTIGVVIPEIESYYYSTILKGIDHVASGAGLRLITFYSNDTNCNEIRGVKDLLLNRVEGLIICISKDTVDFLYLQQLIDDNVPLILLERNCDEIKSTQVVTDNFHAGYEVTEHLIKQGCRRIALITNLEPMSVDNKRLKGYAAALDKYNIPYDRDLIFHATLNQSTSYEAAVNLLKLDNIPDAIIGNTDIAAMTAMKVVKEAGMNIPYDIAIAGFNDELFASFLEPSLTSVSQPAYLMGMKAMEIMLDVLDGKRGINTPDQIILESALVIRNSTLRRK